MSFGAAAPDPRQALQAPVYQYNSDPQRVEMKVFRWQQDGVWVCESCHATQNVMAPNDQEISQGILDMWYITDREE